MVNYMITTACFSICGYFNYPVIKNSILLKFVESVSDIAPTDVNIEFISVDKRKIDHDLLFESGDFSSAYSTDLSLLKSERCTPLSVCFNNRFNVTSEILIRPIDCSGYEVAYLLEEEELDTCDEKYSVIQECAAMFFESLRPLYGCCGTEMFTDGIEHIEESNIINNKFYCIGYVGFQGKDKFNFLNSNHNIESFHVRSLQDGNMYLNKDYAVNRQI